MPFSFETFCFEAFNAFYQFLDSFAFLVLAALGLAVIFGMMGIVNLAHGEFIMLGAYATTLLARKGGVPLPLAIPLAAVAVGLLGVGVERLIVRHLHHRPLDSVVATWGLGLILTQGMLILLGPSLEGVSTPLGAFAVGASTYSVYRVVLGLCALGALGLTFWLFGFTGFGRHARATMQNAAVAQSLGVDTGRMYALTFGLGAALAGLAGGLYAPTTTVVPHFGSGFTVESFVTVMVGGANPLAGTTLSGLGLGAVNSVLAKFWGTFIARVGLLLATILVIRVLPQGVTGLLRQRVVRGA